MSGFRSLKRFRYWLKGRMTWWQTSIRSGPLVGRRWCAVTGIRYIRGAHGEDEARELAALLKPGAVFYDVGAHVGYVSLMAADIVGQAGRVIAFEPLPLNIKFLRKHVAINRVENLELLAVAVNDRAGESFFEIAGGTGRGRIDGAARRGIPVRMVQLDELVASGRLPPPAVIKMDVEGAEARALEGASRLLTEHKPAILLSTHGDAVKAECEALLRRHGYRLRAVSKRDLVAVAGGVLAAVGALACQGWRCGLPQLVSELAEDETQFYPRRLAHGATG